MKTILIILIVLAGVIALLLIIALFVRKAYSIEHEITIGKSRQEVFDYIKYLKNQDHFSVWATMDPGMKKEYRGTDGTVGFVSAWDSNNKNVGKGEQEIVKITEGERIDFIIRFIRPFESQARSYMTTESVSADQTAVRWGFDSEMKYPMNLMLLFMDMEKLVGKDLSTGLANLKGVLEKNP
ncbi:MAG TPA: SRPBCC family protein [Bacteroidales bacterium]|nr:SRPBCC family protein [Bacteroidales bacterium]